MSSLNKTVLIIGAGGHASVLVDTLRKQDYRIAGLVARDKPADHPIFEGLKWFSADEDVLSFNAGSIMLVNAIGSLPGQDVRFNVFSRFKELGYKFATIISPNAIVSSYAVLGEGVQVMPGAIVNANAHIGENSIINTGVIVEHDCHVGSHNHLAPGAVMCGGVKTDSHVHIGTGSNVIQGIHIGEHTVVGAGSTVTKDLERNKTLYVAKPFLR